MAAFLIKGFKIISLLLVLLEGQARLVIIPLKGL